MAGAKAPLQFVGDFWQVDVKGLRLGIYFLLVGSPDNGIAFGFELCTVFIERARIFFEVLALPELQSVYKYRGDSNRRLRSRYAHEAQMSVMDVAHGWHDRYLRFAPQPFTELRDCFDNFHRLGPRRDGESRGRVHLFPVMPRLRPASLWCHSPRLKNSRGPRISEMRRNNKAKSSATSTKLRWSLLTISSGAAENW